MELILQLDGCTSFQTMLQGNHSSYTLETLKPIMKQARVFTLTSGITMLLFGIPGAILSAMVTYRNSTKKSSVTPLLISNTAASIMVLLMMVPSISGRCYDFNLPHVINCAVFSWIVSTMTCVNVYSLMWILATRFLAVAFPHTLFIKIFAKTGIKTTMAMVVVCSLYCVRFFFHDYGEDCVLIIANHKIPWIYVTIEFLLPIVIPLILSLLMVLLMRNDKHRITSPTMHHQTVLFIRLTMLSSTCIFLTSVSSIVHFSLDLDVAYGKGRIDPPWPDVRKMIAEDIIIITFIMRYAFDIFLYFACSRRFRGGLIQVIRLKKLLKHNVFNAVINLDANVTMVSEESSRSFRLPMRTRSKMLAQLQRHNSKETEDRFL